MRTLILLPLSFTVALAQPDAAKTQRSSDEISLPIRQSSPAGTTVYLLNEDFEGTFPPAGWTVVNPDGGRTWQRTTAASGYGEGSASVRIRFYDYTPNAGQMDSLISPPVTGLTATDSLSFDYALSPFETIVSGPDTVEVYLSTDDGATYPVHFVTLSTADSTAVGVAWAFVPEAPEWGTRRFPLPPSVAGATVRFLFLARNHYGQNFYLDNVKAGTQATDDISTEAQVSPPDGGYVIETFPFTPEARFRNSGTASQTVPFPVGFEIIDTADVTVYTSTKSVPALDPESTVTILFDPLPAGLAAGHYDTRIIAQLAGDLLRANDTLYGEFTAESYVRTLPYAEDFEGPADDGWSSRKVTGSLNEWVRAAPNKPSQIVSAFDGTLAWITSAESVYQDNQNAALYSPYFDLSSATDRTVLEFHHNFLIEPGYDGAILECSTNGGSLWSRMDPVQGTGVAFNTEWSRRWYNDTSSFGTPTPPKWSATSTAYAGNTGGWIRSTTPLGPIAGEPLVRFRWRFRTDESEGTEGWAVDAVRIFEDSLKVVQVPTETGWNLLSVPVIPPFDGVQQIYPNSASPFAFGFSASSGYQQVGFMEQGTGYWIRMIGPMLVEIEGRGVFEDTLTLLPGWNIIGSLSLPVHRDSIVQNPPGHIISPFFGFIPSGGYEETSTLWPGQAVWVKSTGGSLILRGVWERRTPVVADHPEGSAYKGK